MIRRMIDNPRFLDQVKYLHGFALVVTVALGGFMLWTGATGCLQAVRTERTVQARRVEYQQLLRRSNDMQARQMGAYSVSATGVEGFAVQMSAMAKAHHVTVESLAPEGAGGVLDVSFDNTNLGQWGIDLVSVRGRGKFDQVMDVLDELGSRAAPMRLESYSLQSLDTGATGVVEFQITVTVYQRKGRSA